MSAATPTECLIEFIIIIIIINHTFHQVATCKILRRDRLVLVHEANAPGTPTMDYKTEWKHVEQFIRQGCL